MEYRYSIEHIEGANNVWADLISRWAGQSKPVAIRSSAKRLTGTKRKRKVKDIILEESTLSPRPLDSEGFVWPNLEQIAEAQRDCRPPPTACKAHDGVWRIGDRIWIPGSAKNYCSAS
ncbi:hypothetical protein PF008_g20094 [Phytophthora fragariae]|uniref:Reverse transcriptase RNase H-like domain-containing protein n=1 Tax=Phytophthora fragariae TaxID=53985 RepID=A0A6G0R0H5_9STRA|nr:hypothetical protein PF008_g20094 [Phytophthora fragariae]